MASGRSDERKAEVTTMDAIERAMSRIDGLTPKAQARVRAWVAEEYANGQAPAAAEDPSG